MLLRKIFKSVSLLCVCCIMQSCQTKFHNGTLVSDEQIIMLAKDKPSKAEVENLVGYPNVIPDYTEDSWYYVYRQMTQRSFLDPVINNQVIVRITFTKNTLDTVEKFENLEFSNLKIAKEYTKSQFVKKNPIQEYIGNIGRFYKHNKKGERR